MTAHHSETRHRLISRLTHLGLGFLFLNPLLALTFRVTVRRSRQRVPHPCVFAANHRSFIDPPFVAMWSREPISFLAKAELWRVPIIRHLLMTFRAVPVDRDNPGISSMKGAIERLRSGISVLVFPEGTRTRSGRLGPMRDGPALFARRAGVPLVPMYIHRTECCWPIGSYFPWLWGPRLEVRIGKPLVAPTGLNPRDADAWVTERLRLWMLCQERELLPSNKPWRTSRT